MTKKGKKITIELNLILDPGCNEINILLLRINLFAYF